MTELPLACSLGPADLRTREREIRALFGGALVGSERADGRLTLRFRPGTHERVKALAAAERECCGFLDIVASGGAAGPVLEFRAPAGADEALTGFAELAEDALRA